MFTYVELRNFKSLKHIKFDFRRKKNEFKRFVAIYGENGSGKSNFVSAVQFLSKTMSSLTNSRRLNLLKTKWEKDNLDLNILTDDMLENIGLGNISDYFKKCRMIDCDEISSVTYGFLINDIEGYYTISFNDESIVKEELYYLTNKQRGILFSIEDKNDEIVYKFNPHLFKDKKYEKEIIDNIEMYWGKHSLLAIILEETRDKNAKFIDNNISINLLLVISSFLRVFILCKSSRNKSNITSGSDIHIRDFSKIELNIGDKKTKKQIHIIEKLINDFYTQAYTDIMAVFYIKTPSKENIILYELYVKKLIAGKERIIPFNLESAGTQNVLFVFRAILEAINGQTVVYDEIDDGIHDLLILNMLRSVQDEIEGQLIITTHNTLLLEDIDSKSAYVIYTDYEGNKEARCLDDYEIRVQSSNNQRRLYLNGVFGGVPYGSDIDYSQMHLDDDEDYWEE